MEVGIVGDLNYSLTQTRLMGKVESKIFDIVERAKDKGATTVYTTLKLGLDRVALRAARSKNLTTIVFSEIYTELSWANITIVGDEIYIADFVDYLVVIDTGRVNQRLDRIMKYKQDNIMYVNYILDEEKYGSYSSVAPR